jgi:RecB family exonuclease
MSSDLSSDFNWTVHQASSWPPKGRRQPPYGPTVLEVMRSCALRFCFDSSPGYERRMGYAARIGSAYHQTLESLINDPPEGSTDAEAAEEARTRFFKELDKQHSEAEKRPREVNLPPDDARLAVALDAIVVEAQKLARFYRVSRRFRVSAAPASTPSHDITSSTEPEASADLIPVDVEHPVRSQDGLFQGRIDRVEHLPQGLRITDTKTALREDVPGRYERQLQLYAYLWYETYGEWPAEAQLLYPFTATTHTVPIDPETCMQVVSEFRELVAAVQEETRYTELANPGDTCKVCEFRPWCVPFWSWQASERAHTVALERTYLGFEGTITSIDLVKHHWRVLINWRGVTVRLIVPEANFPHLRNASPGMRIRCLEFRLRGQRFQPQADPTGYSEIFLVRS